MSALPLLLATGAVQVSLALPVAGGGGVDPEEPEPPEEPELPVEPELEGGVVEPELPALEGGLLEELAGEPEPEPEPPPHPERMSTAAETAQTIFSALNDGKSTSSNPNGQSQREATIRLRQLTRGCKAHATK